MSNVKRTLSALLAVVMIFTTMTVAFTVIGGAAPTVPRTAASVMNPNVSITVPSFIETYGTDYYQRGSNVKAGGQIYIQITTANGAEATDVALACSDAGISLGARIKQGQDGYAWPLNGGTLKTAPAADGSSMVKWTFTYQVNGIAYISTAWSQVKPLFNNPGFSVYLTHNNSFASHATENYHIEWIQPLYGNEATSTDDSNAQQCYINIGARNHVLATGPAASSYYWRVDRGSTGGNRSDTCGAWASGIYYVDVGKYSDLSQTPLQTMVCRHNLSDEDGNHPFYYEGATISGQTLDGASTNAYSMTVTGETKLSGAQVVADSYIGAIPAAGHYAIINTQIKCEGNVTRTLGVTATSSHTSTTYYTMAIISYDKTELETALATATAANYQPTQFLNAAPSGAGSAFRTWDQYYAALMFAWYIYGREDVSQEAVQAAASGLNAAMPKYNSGTGRWESGMMYGPADYSRIDSIIATIPDVLDPDFYAAYSDGTYGKYYQYSYASALVDALDDIAYDRPLDSRYQTTVDAMRTNLANALSTLEGKTKMVSVEYVANQTDVRNLPAASTTNLIGTVQKPSTDPSKSYYRFTGWYYDEACTQSVTWPLGINVNDGYFKANLNNKNDNAGVAYTLYAGWQLTGKSLSFDTQGGSSIPMVTGENGASYSGPTEIPTKPGWKFVGWYLDATTQNPVDWSTFTFGSVSVVYAKWEKDTFTVTFNAMGGTFANGSNVYTATGLYGDAVAEPTPPTKNGNGFAGWYYDSATTQRVDFNSFSIPSSNTTIYAKWSADIRNITLQFNNGSAPSVLTYAIGAQVSAPNNPARAGFTFKQWYYNAALTQPVTFPFNMGADNLTLYASWTPLKFSVYFSAGEGTMPASFNASDYQNLDCGSVLVAPESPVREGYVFTGWTWEGEPYEFTVVPPQNITLVATWEVEPNMVKFRLRTDMTGTVSQGDIITATVSMQANHIVSTHAFLVYYDNRYLAPYDPVRHEAVQSQITGASACSKTPGAAYFTVIQNAGGNVTDCGNANGRIMAGIAPTNQYFPADWAIDNYTLKDDYKYYEFVYFTVTDTRNGTRMQPDPEQDIASFQFIVRDDAPIADGVSTFAQILMPDFYTRTPDRTSGKIYAAPEESTEYVAKKNYENTTNIVLDGDHRFAVQPMASCRINFVTNGGSALDSMDAKVGRTITLPTTTRPYYDFLGWTLTNSVTDTDYVDASAYLVPNTNAVTLYAKWGGQMTTYYVRHHKQNLTATGWLDYEQEPLQGQVGTVVNAQPKDYAGFTCTNAGESGEVRGDSANPLIIDLYYLRNTVNIKLNANGGTFSNGQQTVTLSGMYEADVVNPYSNPTRTGYTFGGWEYKSASYTISQYPASDITLIAKWTANSVTVRFFLNGSSTPSWTKSGKYGDPITAPTVSVQDGQIFTGWVNGSGVPFTYTTFPAADEDFYGDVVIDGYNLTLYVDGVQYGQPIGVRNGTQVTESMIAYTPQPGYTFTGWRTSNSVDAALAVFPMTLRANTTLYGFTTRESYSIRTFIYVDGELEDGPSISNLYYGQAFELPEADDYTDAGYGFRGWYTDANLTNLYTKPSTMPAQNIVLYGEYYELVGTIEFNLNGGTGTAPASITEAFNTTVTLPGGTGMSKPLYKFGGWATSPTSTTAITRYTIESAEKVTLYAIWTVNYATVSFDLNGAESGTRPDTMQVEVGTTLNAADLPAGADFVREGFIFAGWADKKTSTTPLDAYTVTATGSKTLYAVWAAANVELIAKTGSTTVIDNTRGFIYGLDFQVTEAILRSTYLDVEGNGHLEFDYEGAVGTGTVVRLINDYSGNVDATYTIVIFGDVNGDGMLNATDVNAIRSLNARLTTFAEGSAKAFAADITHDGAVNSSDVTGIRSANGRLTTINQVG